MSEQMSGRILTTCVVIVILFFIFIIAFKEPYQQKFMTGQFVEHILDGRKGIVIYRWDGDMYKVRFSYKQQSTKNHMFGSGGDIKEAPYADVTCREFELKEIKGKKDE